MAEKLSTPPIQIYTFGTLQVIRNGTLVEEGDWRTRQARQLLKILITERPRPVATDRLIEILWPESESSAAATTLRSAVNALRNVLEPDRPNRAPSSYVHTQSPGYAFRSHPDIWLDVEVFERLLNQAERSRESAAKLPLLEEALALYRDDYLSGDLYVDWVKSERERLREHYFEALLRQAAIHADQGNYSAAISACRRILARDEVRENAYQALMRYQAESGDSAAALLTYERCRHVLSEQLGADPSPITQQLHGRILNGEITVAPVATLHSHVGDERPAPPSEDVGDGPLPQQTLLPALEESAATRFVGRESEVAAIEEALARAMSGAGSIVVLAGEMGVGKSRLAYQVLRSAEGDGATVISATCQRLEQSLPYAPLADALGRYLQLLPDSSLRRLPQAALGQLTQILPSLQDRLPLAPTATEIHLSPEENRQRLIEGMVSFLTGLAQLRPLVLFLDDVHWADAETLAVVSRLSGRLTRSPLLLLFAYREGDLAENEALQTLLHALKRRAQTVLLTVERLRLADVRTLIQQLTGEAEVQAEQLAQRLYETTSGNALFLTEALKALQERAQSEEAPADLAQTWQQSEDQLLPLSRSERIREIIRERIERLPAEALKMLQLAAVVGRDFSIELLEGAATSDPLGGLEVLLRRQFLVERLDERLDFVHQVVRQVAYDDLHTLLRRRLHRQIAAALEQSPQGEQNPAEIAFHYGEAGLLNRLDYARFSVLAGEKLLRTFSLNRAIDQFDNALNALESLPERPSDLVTRALQGRGLAYESLLDPDGVTDSYTRLRQWALQQGDKELALMVHTRLTTLLGLVGQQAESNALMEDLILDRRERVPTGRGRDPLPALADLLARRQVLFSEEESPVDEADWPELQPPPPVPGDPVTDITDAVGPVHAALPLLIYGWALQVQGQFEASAHLLEAAVALSEETGQRSLASLAYHQLAVTVRLQGDVALSHSLNEQSKAINHQVHGVAAQLASLWPRISSAYQALERHDLDLAEDRLCRVRAFLAERDSFRTHRNSTIIGLGLVALERGDLDRARALFSQGLSDPHNRYPFTYVKGLLGQARIAHQRGNPAESAAFLRRALTYAARRSLVREYAECVQAIAEIQPAQAPIERLQRSVLSHIERTGLAVRSELDHNGYRQSVRAEAA